MPRIPIDSLLGGNARSVGRDGLAFAERCEKLAPIVQGRAYLTTFYIVTAPDLIEEILVKKPKAFHKPGLLKGLRIVFGDSLLTADGDVWRERRRLLQPAFHARHDVEHGAHICEGIAQRLATWPEEGTLDVHEAVVDLCITNLTRTLFGLEDPGLTADIKELAALCHEITEAGMSFRFPYYGLLTMLPSLAYLPFGRRVRRLSQSIVERVTNARRGVVRDDFFSRLMKGNDGDRCPMGRNGLRDELVTMLLAGHETAAAAVSWALYLLARHPNVLEALRGELDAVCGEALPTARDLERLPLLDAVVRETYRLYPPTHRIGRRVAEPVTIGGHSLEIGAEVAIPIWAVQRSTRHFDAPLEFRPERWTESFRERLPRFAYFPFSGGPRVCIGRALVTMEDALIIGSIVKSFAFSIPPELRIEPKEGLTLLPGDGSFRPLLRRREASARCTA